MKTFFIIIGVLLINALCLSGMCGDMPENGSFEKVTKLINYDKVAEKGFDVEKELWPEAWFVQRYMGPAKIRIISAEDAPDGKRFLQISASKPVHLYTKGGSAANTYKWTLWVRTRPAAHKKRSKLNLVYYKYSYANQETKRLKFKGSGVIKKLNLPHNNKWKKFSGIFELDDPNAKEFNIVLDVFGNVDIDDVKFIIDEEE